MLCQHGLEVYLKHWFVEVWDDSLGSQNGCRKRGGPRREQGCLALCLRLTRSAFPTVSSRQSRSACVYVCKGVATWQRRCQLWRLTAEVWRPRTGLQGSPSTTECVILVLFWPWFAQRKKRKKTETRCWSLEGSSGTGESVRISQCRRVSGMNLFLAPPCCWDWEMWSHGTIQKRLLRKTPSSHRVQGVLWGQSFLISQAPPGNAYASYLESLFHILIIKDWVDVAQLTLVLALIKGRKRASPSLGQWFTTNAMNTSPVLDILIIYANWSGVDKKIILHVQFL